MPLDATSSYLPETRAPFVAGARLRAQVAHFAATIGLIGSSAGLFLLLLALA